jgi:Tol biopolymer transport system component
MRRRGRTWLAATALGAVVLAVLALPATAAKDDLDLVSRATDGAAANAGSFGTDVSADGRFVTLVSFATNLSDADQDLVIDAFLRDMVTGATTLISRANGAAGAGGDDRTFIARVSGNGRYVAFDSNATNLSTVDDDTMADVFRRDTVTGATILVTREDGQDGTPAAGAAPSISADGRLITFQSQDDTLPGVGNPALLYLFVRDVDAGTTTLVSRPTGLGATTQDASSFVPVVAANGRFVAFESDADNLTAETVAADRNIFVRDLVANTTTLVSRAGGPAGDPANGRSTDEAISADGRFVAFTSVAANLSTDDRDPLEDVFVRDTVAGTTTLVSRGTGAAGAPGDGASAEPSISADGRYVAFQSTATTFSDADADPVRDVFVRDLIANTTTLVSRAAGPAGAGADTDTEAPLPRVSGDGRYVAFVSDADNLSALDDDAVPDVFRRDVLGVPSGPAPGPVAPTARSVVRPVARCAGLRATIVGTARRNVIRGTAKRDVIAALAGNDLVRGLGGNDLICLGAGADRALGGPGADRILGGPGRDVLLGGPGADRLLGQAGRDRAVGGLGRDRCPVEAKTAC